MRDYTLTGQRHDGYTQLVEMGARWYEGRIGRWVSADIIVPNPAQAQSFNRFSYCQNNPLRYRDPTGHYHAEIHHDMTERLALSVSAQVRNLIVSKGELPRLTGDQATAIAVAIADWNAWVDVNPNTISVNPSMREDGMRVGAYWHFTSLADAEGRLLVAISARNIRYFGQALHAYQDYWSHTRQGFSLEGGDAGEAAINRLCPECKTLLSEETLRSRSRAFGHAGLDYGFADHYTPAAWPYTPDPNDVSMEMGTEYWLVLFFCDLYGIDPHEYWSRYGEIPQPGQSVAQDRRFLVTLDGLDP